MKQINYSRQPQIISYDEVLSINNNILKDPDSRRLPIFSSNNKKENVPIIVDYGSNTFKAGWGNYQHPDLVFRPLTNRTKDQKTFLSSCVIGTAGRDIDIFRGNYQSPFERNLIYHTGSFEHLNDYIFNELKCGNDGHIQHPLIITEPCANAEQTRAVTLEFLFECYGIPSIMMGVDALWGCFAQSNLSNYLSQNKLLISFGDQTTHIIPIVDGQVLYSNIKRINIGGNLSLSLLYKNIQSRHHHLKQYLSFSTIEKIHRGLTFTAIDFNEQLKYFLNGNSMVSSLGYRDKITEENKQYYTPNYYNKFQEPIIVDLSCFKQKVTQNIDEEEQIRKKEIRQKQSERLKEALAKRKQEKKQQLQQKLQEYETLNEKVKLEPQTAKIELENQIGPKGVEELRKRIKIIKVKLGILPKEALDEDKFLYIEIPDAQLTPEQLSQKRYQIVMKQAQINKAIKKEEEKQKKEEIRKFRQEQPEVYLKSLYDKRANLIKKINDRRKKQQEISTRNSRFNQKRMQTLAYLGQQDQQGKEDDFGMKDEDWDIYRGITKELDSEDEDAEFKLQELELKLKELDPDYEQKILDLLANQHQLGMDLFKITLSADRIKCNEIYFQPSLVGVDQCGLIDAILLSLKSLLPEQSKKLLENIYLIGGGALTKGLAERIQSDLRREVNQEQIIKVSVAKDCIFDTWYGMQQFSNQNPSMVGQFSISKEDYDEYGVSNPEILKIHPFSNIFE